MFALSSGRLGQVQILAAIIFLFLIPTTVIIAQNATNSSFENLSIEGNLIQLPQNLTDSNMSDVTNQSPTEQPPENQISETATNSSVPVDEELYSFPLSNQTLNETLPETNQTMNITEPVNGTEQQVNETTLNETNVTPPEDTMTESWNVTEIPPSDHPYLTVSVSGPDKITRGEDAVFSVEILNTGNGTAFHVAGFWMLPDTADRPAFGCDDLEPGESCKRELVLPTTAGTRTGIKEIGIEVVYDG